MSVQGHKYMALRSGKTACPGQANLLYCLHFVSIADSVVVSDFKMLLVAAQKFHCELCKIFMQDKKLRGCDSLRTMVSSTYQACKVLFALHFCRRKAHRFFKSKQQCFIDFV